MRKYLWALIVSIGWLPMAAQTESLVIGPGDLLHVQVFDTPEMDQHPRVGDDGEAPLLFVGKIKLVGETPDQAARSIEALMEGRHVMLHPQVVVTVEQYATQEVSVGGEVNRPGSYAITTPRAVLEVLNMAGGLNAMADRNIVIERRAPGMEPIKYFVSNDPDAAIHNQVKVFPGDTILVSRTGLVYLLGDVGRPGGYPIAGAEPHMTLLEALAGAGSTNKTAVISGVKLMRKNGDGYVEVQIHLGRIEAGKEADPKIMAGDVVIVPFSYTKNFILNGTGIAASLASAAIYAW